MGFNKRYLNKEGIIIHYKQGFKSLMDYILNPDSLIIEDKFSEKIVDIILNEDNIKDKLKDIFSNELVLNEN